MRYINFLKQIIAVVANNIEGLIKSVKEGKDIVTDWFKANEIIVNPNKFQGTIVKRNTHKT